MEVEKQVAVGTPIKRETGKSTVAHGLGGAVEGEGVIVGVSAAIAMNGDLYMVPVIRRPFTRDEAGGA